MIEQLQKQELPSLGVNTKDLKVYCQAFSQRQGVLLMIRQLNQLAKCVQRHRGMTMAILAGSRLFQGDLMDLQRQVERRLASIQAFASQLKGVIKARDQEGLHNAWSTIRADWQDDDVIDNFELHSHFIEQLRSLRVNLARELEQPVSVSVAESLNIELVEPSADAYPKTFQLIELLSFAVKQVPEMVEQVARIRGLATFATAKGECDDHHDRKLRYAISCARTANEKLRSQAERLESVLKGALPCLAMVKTYELKLMFLMNTVEMDVLSGATITASSHSLFKLATEIIDVYLNVVDDAMALVGRWQEDDLEDWLQAAS